MIEGWAELTAVLGGLAALGGGVIYITDTRSVTKQNETKIEGLEGKVSAQLESVDQRLGRIEGLLDHKLNALWDRMNGHDKTVGKG